MPGTRRLIFGGSDFRVHDVDMAAEKPEPHALGDHGHDSYVTSLAVAGNRWAVSGGYDGKLIWWDLEGGERSPRDRGAREVDPRRGRDGRRRDDRQRRRRHGLPPLGRRDRRPAPRAARPRGSNAASLSLDAFRLRLLARRPVSGDRRQGGPRRRLGRRRRPAGRHARSARHVHLGPGPAPAFDRRHPRRWPSRPTAPSLAVGGIGKIGNIDHLDSPARIEVFDWRKGERTHEFTDLPKGIVERLVFLPDGNRLLAAGGHNDGFLLVVDLKAKSVLVQEKASTHVHDAVFGDTFETLFTAAHGKLAVYELKG